MTYKNNFKKAKFIIVGSGWRSLYYVRAAKALPEFFELSAMLCRSKEKAEKMSEEHGIYTTVSIEECQCMNPDFVVVAVNKDSVFDVSVEWMRYGFTVLCETPAALEISKLETLWQMHLEGYRLAVAEQYAKYPQYKAMLDILRSNIIGEPSCINISLAHDYHGASLMRAFLNIEADTPFFVTAKTYAFPTVETLNRYEKFNDGRVKDKERTIAAFEFADGKAAWYDFDSEQYRSPIRSSYVRVQGEKGELKDNVIRFLDENYELGEARLQAVENIIMTGDPNPNLNKIKEIEKIILAYSGGDSRVVYEPYFGKCGLAQDETAAALLMAEAAEYDRAVKHDEGILEEDAKETIRIQETELRNALQDAYMAILMRKAAKTGEKVCSDKRGWHRDSITDNKAEKMPCAIK